MEVEFLYPGANAPGVNSKIKKIQKNVKKFWIFLWHTYTNVCCARKISSQNHIGEICGKKTKSMLWKCYYKSILELWFCFFAETSMHVIPLQKISCMWNAHQCLLPKNSDSLNKDDIFFSRFYCDKECMWARADKSNFTRFCFLDILSKNGTSARLKN